VPASSHDASAPAGGARRRHEIRCESKRDRWPCGCTTARHVTNDPAGGGDGDLHARRDGRTISRHVVVPSRLDGVKKGDDIGSTYTEALLVSVTREQ
jgi:hypothetical protein